MKHPTLLEIIQLGVFPHNGDQWQITADSLGWVVLKNGSVWKKYATRIGVAVDIFNDIGLNDQAFLTVAEHFVCRAVTATSILKKLANQETDFDDRNPKLNANWKTIRINAAVLKQKLMEAEPDIANVISRESASVVLQFRPRNIVWGREDGWQDQDRFIFCCFPSEIEWAKARVDTLNAIDVKYEWRVKPQAPAGASNG